MSTVGKNNLMFLKRADSLFMPFLLNKGDDYGQD